MRRHRWLRRLILLVILLIGGVVVITPEEEAKYHADGLEAVSPDHGVREGEDRKGEETVVGWMLDKIAAGEVELSDENSICQALSDAETEAGVFLTEDNKDKITGFLQTLGNISVEAEDFIDRAKERYQQYSTELVEEANDAINEAVEDAVKSAAQNFIDKLKQAVGEFFRDLLP